MMACLVLSEAKKKQKWNKDNMLKVPAPTEKDPNDPNQAHLSYGNNPLHDAARDGDLVMLEKILKRVPGTFTDNRFSKWEYDEPEDYPDKGDKNDGGNTALHLATWMGKKEAVRMLLDHGASINVRNRAGNFPLAWSARHNDTSILEWFLEKGATVNDGDDKGFTALHICAYANAVEACRLLLNKGANVNAATEKGYTAIFTAAEHHNTAVALLLMDSGADMTLEDEGENGPLDLCSGRAATQKYEGLPHQVTLVETMREKGALYHEERKRKAKEAAAKKGKAPRTDL